MHLLISYVKPFRTNQIKMLPCNLVPAVQVAINNSTHLHTKNSYEYRISRNILQVQLKRNYILWYRIYININSITYSTTYCISEDKKNKNIEVREWEIEEPVHMPFKQIILFFSFAPVEETKTLFNAYLSSYLTIHTFTFLPKRILLTS